MGNKHKIVVLVLFSTLCFGAFANDDEVRDGSVYIIIEQRSGRKPVTIVRGISSQHSFAKILKDFKKECKCDGTVDWDKTYGKKLQLQGDQSEKMSKFLTNAGIVEAQKIKVKTS